MADQTSAHEALINALDGEVPKGRSTPFVCPYPDCRVLAQHHWGILNNLNVRISANTSGNRQASDQQTVVFALCEACSRETIFLDSKMIWPWESDAPPPAADMPANIQQDYEEAAIICADSPRGAAALLRLAIQKLCSDLGSQEKDINKAIGGFVAENRISPNIQKALDAVRVIGNEAVHPGKMDLRDDQATVNSLFHLVNFIVEKMITEPGEIDRIYRGLPSGKLAGIAQRDGNAPKCP